MTRGLTPVSNWLTASMGKVRYSATKTKRLAYLTQAEHSLVRSLFEETRGMRANVRGMGGALDSIYVSVRLVRPQVVLETGVANGASSLYILRALHKNGLGHLYSIDVPNLDDAAPLPKGKETGWLVPANLRSRWTLVEGKSEVVMGGLLSDLGGIGIFYHDSDHSYANMTFEFEKAWPWLKRGGLIISDNVDLNTAFQDFCRKVGMKWVELEDVGFGIKG